MLAVPTDHFGMCALGAMWRPHPRPLWGIWREVGAQEGPEGLGHLLDKSAWSPPCLDRWTHLHPEHRHRLSTDVPLKSLWMMNPSTSHVPLFYMEPWWQVAVSQGELIAIQKPHLRDALILSAGHLGGECQITLKSSDLLEASSLGYGWVLDLISHIGRKFSK
jgi:hypothetical protein